MPTNFELKRLKPKLDIVKKPENRVHELTDSNVSLAPPPGRVDVLYNMIKIIVFKNELSKMKGGKADFSFRVLEIGIRNNLFIFGKDIVICFVCFVAILLLGPILT